MNKPIDVLILEAALATGRATADVLSKTLGEDRRRVEGWLDRFYRIGAMQRKIGFYFPIEEEARKYLATRRQPVP